MVQQAVDMIRRGGRDTITYEIKGKLNGSTSPAGFAHVGRSTHSVRETERVSGLLLDRHDRELNASVLRAAFRRSVAGNRMVLTSTHHNEPLLLDSVTRQI